MDVFRFARRRLVRHAAGCGLSRRTRLVVGEIACV
jgi:hypothetical protein